MKKRDSNLELLRLVSMFIIILYHFIMPFASESYIIKALRDVLHIGVVCFVLISGYFGIKANLKGVINLFCLVVFYSLTLYLFSAFYQKSFSTKILLTCFFPFSNNFYWFIIVYIQLYLIAPFVNKAIENLTRRQFIITLFIFAYFCFYLGLIREQSMLVGGKNLINFIFIYLIGRYIYIYYPVNESSRKTLLKKSITWYFSIVFFIIFSVGFAPTIISDIVNRLSFPYNSPLLIIMAVLVLNIFRYIKFQSTIINYFASSALAIYLIHENIYFNQFTYAPIRGWYDNQHYLVFALFLMIYALFVFILCLLIDKVRVFIVNFLNLEKLSIKTEKLLSPIKIRVLEKIESK